MSNADLKRPVLVVDDEADIRDLMEMTLMKMGLSVYTAQGVAAAKQQLAERRFSLVLTDMRMPDGSGLDVVDFINSEGLDVPVAVITAFGNADQAVQALKNGAFDYLQKPITLAQLRSLVKSAIKINEGEEPATAASPPVSESPPAEEPAPTAPPAKPQAAAAKPTNVPAAVASANAEIPRLLGTSALMEDVRQMVRKLAKTMVPVYIAGESGSGKEQAARSIHELSARREQPFVAVNCGAIPENLMESEFFGYKKGSFTGADTDRLGFFQHADGGTLFLDEVADLPLAMQVKLLRVLQEGTFYPVGGREQQKIDMRLVSATNANLPDLVKQGKFREDLYYRIKGVTIETVALDERREDIPLLIQFFLEQLSAQYGQKLQLESAAISWFLQKHWPGNVRELKNTLESVAAIAQQGVIRLADIQLLHLEQQSMEADNELVPGSALSSLDEQVKALEIRLIQQAMAQYNGNKSQASRALGISRQGLLKKIERYALTDLGDD